MLLLLAFLHVPSEWNADIKPVAIAAFLGPCRPGQEICRDLSHDILIHGTYPQIYNPNKRIYIWAIVNNIFWCCSELCNYLKGEMNKSIKQINL